MIEIPIKGDKPHIELCDLLKIANLCESGGVAKHAIAAGEVKVDGQVELRKRAKIKKGQVVEFASETIKIISLFAVLLGTGISHANQQARKSYKVNCNESVYSIARAVSGASEKKPFDTILKKHFSSVEEARLSRYVETKELSAEKLEYAARVEAAELKSGGKLITSAQDFDHLPNEIYPYLIDSKGHVMIIPRGVLLDEAEIAKNGGKYLGNHRAMIEKLKALTHSSEDPIIVAAGEFEIANGRVNSFTNRSGNFRGSKNHLDLAVDYMKESGLKIEPHTYIDDVSSGKEGIDSKTHLEALIEVDKRKLIYNHPELRKLYVRAEKVKKDFANMFPSIQHDKSFTGGPGKADLVKLGKAMFDVMSLGQEKTGLSYSDFEIVGRHFQALYTKGEGVPRMMTENFKDGGVELVEKKVVILEKISAAMKAHPAP